MRIPPTFLIGEDKKIIITKDSEYYSYYEVVIDFFRRLTQNYGKKEGGSIIETWEYEDKYIDCKYVEIFGTPSGCNVCVSPLYQRVHLNGIVNPFDEWIDILYLEDNGIMQLKACVPIVIDMVMNHYK